jgi:hypothetical protein
LFQFSFRRLPKRGSPSLRRGLENGAQRRSRTLLYGADAVKLRLRNLCIGREKTPKIKQDIFLTTGHAASAQRLDNRRKAPFVLARMEPEAVLRLFESVGAIQRGHFEWTSGLHSEAYVECALVLQCPKYAAQLGRVLAAFFQDLRIGCVASPALGGPRGL